MRHLLFLFFSCLPTYLLAQTISQKPTGDICSGTQYTYTFEIPEEESEITFVEWLPNNDMDYFSVGQNEKGQPTIDVIWILGYGGKTASEIQARYIQTFVKGKPRYRTAKFAVKLEPLSYNDLKKFSFLISGPSQVETDQPASFQLNLLSNEISSLPADSYSWTIRDAQGKVVYTRKSDTKQLELPSGSLPLGTYTVSCSLLNKCGEPNPRIDRRIQEKTFAIICSYPEQITGIEGPGLVCINKEHILTVLGASDATAFEFDLAAAPGTSISDLGNHQLQLTASQPGEQSIRIRASNGSPDPSCRYTDWYTYTFIAEENVAKVNALQYRYDGNQLSLQPDPEGNPMGSPLLTVNTCEEAVNSCNSTLEGLRMLGELSLGEDLALRGTASAATAFSISVNVQLELLYKGSTVGSTYTYLLSLNQDQPKAAFLLQIPQDKLAELRSIRATIPDLSSTNATAYELDKLALQLYYDEDKSLELQDIQISALNAVAPASGRRYQFSWASNCSEVQNYQLQLLKIFEGQPAPTNPADPRWKTALTLETSQAEPSVALSIGEGQGTYYWRVRPLGNYENGAGDARNYLSWEQGNYPIAQFTFTDPDKNRNYNYGRVITEGNKQKESMVFANGLQQIDHELTRLNEDQRVFAVQTLQDYIGRNALSSLPVPVGNTLTYQGNNLLKGADGSRLETEDIDQLASLWQNNQAYDAAGYYGGAGSEPAEAYVPSAEGYPYQRSIFTRDGTGRVREQSGPGSTHALKADATDVHTIRTFFGTAAQPTLEALFGQEQAPLARNVQKIITLDAKNTASVQFIDKNGKTIATALSSASASTNLLPLRNETAPKEIVETFTKEDLGSWGPYGSTSKKVIVITEPTQVTLNYALTPDALDAFCNLACTTCDYRVEFQLSYLDEEGVLDQLIPGPVVAGGDCSNLATLSQTETFNLSRPGRYSFEKRIRSYTADANGNRFLDLQLQALEEQLNNDFAVAIDEFNTLIEDGLTKLTPAGLNAHLYWNSPYPLETDADGVRSFIIPVGAQNPGCVDLHLKVPFLEPEFKYCEPAFPVLAAEDFLDYFENYWIEHEAEVRDELLLRYTEDEVNALLDFIPSNPGTDELPYLPQEWGYTRSSFAGMMTNLMAETDAAGEKLYPNELLFQTWDSHTRNYVNLRLLSENKENAVDFTEMPPFDMLKSFFSQLQVPKVRYFGPNEYGINTPYAYERFMYDAADALQKACMDELWPASVTGPSPDAFENNLTAEERAQLYHCISSEVDPGLNDPNAPTDPRDRAKYYAEQKAAEIRKEIDEVCFNQRSAFKDAIRQEFYAQGKYIEDDQFTVLVDPTTGRYVYTDTELSVPVAERISLYQFDAMADALVENCRGYGELTVYEDTENQQWMVGTTEEVDRLKMAYGGKFELDLNNATCTADWETIFLFHEEGGGEISITSCGNSLISYFNQTINTIDQLGDLTIRTTEDKLPCPLDLGEDTGVGERGLNIFSYIGPLAKDCNRTIYTGDCQDPERNNFWVSVFDDRRLNADGTQYQPRFGIIWGSVAGNYTYYGSCYPDPNGYDNPDAGIPMLLKPVNDVNGDGQITGCGNNHVFRLNFYRYVNGAKEVIDKRNIVRISSPYLEDPSVVIPGIDPAAYDFLANPAYVKVDLEMKYAEGDPLPIAPNSTSTTTYTISAYIEHSYSRNGDKGDFNFKQRNPVFGEFDRETFCFRYLEPGSDPLPPELQPYTYQAKTTSCFEEILATIETNFLLQQQRQLTAKLDEYRQKYLNTCANPLNFDDQISLRYDLDYHHFTLYYYDRAGNLMQTVPPAGVVWDNGGNHNLKTTYQYNSLGQLVEQQSPDGGITYFYYDAAGRLRFSQNAKQAEEASFSYTKYDALGRVIEVGQSSNLSLPLQQQVNKTGFPESGSEVTRTVYTEPADVRYAAGMPQRFLQNRVSYTLTENSIGPVLTYYSYDPHGNVEWLIQEIPGLDRRKVRYEYELVSGNVTEVIYQEGEEDEFRHRYQYDADNRLLAVLTSRDGVIWDQDARYQYYGHGPLKRVELGEDRIQGLDYVYTIQGWLKGINHPLADPASDPGRDGTSGSTMAPDAFGMSLGYYQGDYSSQASATAAYSGSSLPQPAEGRNLYNGNISSWAERLQGHPAQESTYANQPVARQFVYDELNRIKSSHFLRYQNGWPQTATDTRFATAYTYDGNGNLQNLSRYDQNDNTMDELGYTYQQGTNRLVRVDDQVNGNADMGDFRGSSEYTYDAIGNLVQEVQTYSLAGDSYVNTTDIAWTVYGKVQSVTISSTKNGLANPAGSRSIDFAYDAAGNRIMKRVSHGINFQERSYYVRDAQGNVLAVYRFEQDLSSKTTRLYLAEQPVYGSDRIGNLNAQELLWEVPLILEKGPRRQLLAAPAAGSLQLPVNSPEGTRLARLPLDSLESVGSLSLSEPISNSGYSAALPLETLEGQPLGTLLIGQEGGASLLDAEGQLMSGPESGSPQRQRIRAAANSPALAMPLPGSDRQQWLFTIDAEGRLLRHRVNAGAAGFGTTEAPKGALEQSNEPLYPEAAFAPSLALAYHVARGQGYLLALQKTDNQSLLLSMLPQGIAGEKPAILDTLPGPFVDAYLALSPNGQRLAVLSLPGNKPSWFGGSSQAAELQLYTLSEDFSHAKADTSYLLASGKAYTQPVWQGNALYFSTHSPKKGYALERMSLQSGLQEALLYTQGPSGLGNTADGRLYASLSGTDQLASLNDSSSQASLLSLSLPAGSSLGGSLSQQSIRLGEAPEGMYARRLGKKQYELKDHLGNVRLTLSDRKLSTPVGLTAQIQHNASYYPFGMNMPGISYTGNDYRYGFNGKEKDKEWANGSTYDYGFRIYNPQIAKFLSVDPLTKSYPMLTPYQFASNTPIMAIDLDGLEAMVPDWSNGGRMIAPTDIINPILVNPMNSANSSALMKSNNRQVEEIVERTKSAADLANALITAGDLLMTISVNKDYLEAAKRSHGVMFEAVDGGAQLSGWKNLDDLIAMAEKTDKIKITDLKKYNLGNNLRLAGQGLAITGIVLDATVTTFKIKEYYEQGDSDNFYSEGGWLILRTAANVAAIYNPYVAGGMLIYYVVDETIGWDKVGAALTESLEVHQKAEEKYRDLGIKIVEPSVK